MGHASQRSRPRRRQTSDELRDRHDTRFSRAKEHSRSGLPKCGVTGDGKCRKRLESPACSKRAGPRAARGRADVTGP